MSRLSESSDFGLSADRDGHFGGYLRAYFVPGQGWFSAYYGAVSGYAYASGKNAYQTPEDAVRGLWKELHG